MRMSARCIVKYLSIGVATAALASAVTGCEYFPESTFKLADESRVPKWFAISPELSRADISVSMSYYVKPWGRSATFILQNTATKILKKANGKMACKEPFQLRNPPRGFTSGYPAYELITVDGTTEMIEHRRMEPVFYVTDDPAVWKQYAATGCN